MAKTGLKHTDMRTSELSDAELVAMALEGRSQAAYFALYTRYHAGLSAHISQFVQDREEVEDICMETFEKAFKQLSSFRPDAKFSTWILTIARNTAFDHNDKEKRGRNIMTALSGETENRAVSIADETLPPDEAIIRDQMHEKFVACIEGLPDIYKEVAALCFVDNMGYKEIAEKTGLGLNTVKTRIRRAKEILTGMMLDMEDE
ncbi:MAG: RNA polymerase sigma factor [Candidatus Cryptobacteroides sp.]